MKVYTLIILSFIITACNNKAKRFNTSTVGLPASLPAGDTVIQHRSKEVSLINLIATPQLYHNQKLRVIGYLHLQFEGNGLYLHKDDYEHGIDKNSVWVDVKIKHPEVSELKKFSDHYVIMDGTFDSNMRGHGDMSSGSIKDITRLEIWPYPNPKQ